ncbi:MAG: hypothetical protein CMJ38_08945 [Phycisphaerae bacterium]|nr:hypothetical protein [Phycisphaerae bacterium]
MNRTKCLLILLIVGCSEPAVEQTSKSPENSKRWFVDEAEQMHVAIPWVSGDSGEFNMPEIIGGGGAVLDYDKDGDLDLYIVQGGSLSTDTTLSNKLYRNDDAKFTDVTDSSGTGDLGYGMGVATGDYNNDGFVDLYVTNVGPNVLLKNNGDGTFSDVTEIAGVGDEGWGASTVFADFDQDGDLDLYVINYLVWSYGLELTCYNEKGLQDYCSPTNYMAPARDTLYQNNGDGTFTDVSESAGLGSRFGTGLGVLCQDYTGDGLVDIFVANDGMPDQLWLNKGDFTFVDVAPLRGCALDDEGIAKAGMGVTTDDFDFDGDFDIIVCNLTGESDSLYRNDGEFFTDVTAKHGIRTSTRHATRFGLGLVDFDNDGFLDLFEANGRVQQIGSPYGEDPFAEPNHLLKGSMAGWRVVHDDAVKDIATSRGAVFADFNNDGKMDVYVINRDEQSQLLVNVHDNAHQFAQLEVLNSNGAPALGAIVQCEVGDHTVTKSVQTAYSYLTANDPRVHIGLGEERQLLNVTIQWIDGGRTNFGDLEAGQHRLQQP